MKKKPVSRFVRQESYKINKMNKLVADAIKNNESITEKLLESNAGEVTLGQRMADGVASFGGSWKFIIIFGFVLVSWILLNAIFLLNKGFDPYPFILLNLILSCLAAIQAPIIMMSQNRKEEIDRKRAENDYIINLKAETQISNMDEKINILVIEQMKKMFKLQEGQLQLLNEIKKTLKK
ncbi:MAG: DUF1003 domain-containing protein [candidate division SR1 bacterium]|nr:DUF1003 domain-containing protein [candidate division SR1 bacterium]